MVEGEPTVQYRFLNRDGVEYEELRQTLREGDTLNQPESPSDGGRIFAYWSLVNTPEDEPTRGDYFDSANTSGESYTDHFPGDAMTMPDLPEGQQYPVIRYLRAVFLRDAAQLRVRYYDQTGRILHTDLVDTGATVDPKTMNYTAKQIKTGDQAACG